MQGQVELQYWDSSVFIAWLSSRPQNLTVEQFEGVRALVRMAMAGRSRIITSQITFAEVLEGYMSDETPVMFERFMKRRNVTAVANHLGVIRMAAQIRNTYVEMKNAGNQTKVLKLPDATHLATALIHKVDVVYALDKSDMIRLDGDVAGHKLAIKVPPPPPQQALDFGKA